MRCARRLPEDATPMTPERDYCGWKATTDSRRFRLNCEELTGQTDRMEAQVRQSRFQVFFLTPAPTPKCPLPTASTC